MSVSVFDTHGSSVRLFFFFNDTAPTEISPLPLHDALPISDDHEHDCDFDQGETRLGRILAALGRPHATSKTSRSEEHTSELQSHSDLVCRLLLEKKKNLTTTSTSATRENLSTAHLERPPRC